MWEPIRCFECWLMYFSYVASPRMAAPQLAQQQMLETHSTHAKSAAQMPPASPAFVVSPSASSAPAAAAPHPAQQHAKIQLRTMTPPRSPHTTGSAVCGWLLPTRGTGGPVTLGKGASGTLGKLRAVSEATCEPVAEILDAPWVAPSVASETEADGSWRRTALNASDIELTRRTANTQRPTIEHILWSETWTIWCSNWVLPDCRR